MLQKNAFGQKKFKFHAWVQKCHFGKNEKFPCYLLDFIKSKNTVSKMNGFYLAKDYELQAKDYETALVGTVEFS